MPIACVTDDLTIDWNVASNVPSIVQEATKDFMSDMEYGFYMARPCDSKRNATGIGGDKPPLVAANDADHIEHCVHVLVKNLHSIWCESPWENFVAELKTCHFDLYIAHI